MIESKKVLAIIPARGGSKGIPGKNIYPICGKPLIAWTIEAAQKSKYLDKTILSSDDEEIIEVALQLGCDVPFIRPENISQDETPGIAPVFHALETLSESYDYVCLLQPTSPLRITEDIDMSIEIAHSVKGMCVSVVEVAKSPFWMYQLDSDNHLTPILENTFSRRQELPKTFALNGAVYVAQVPLLIAEKSFLFKDTQAYIMPAERSIDIDSYLDVKICETLLASQ
jgi:N-acylneuraminate cytidylyltransferase